MSSTNNPVSLGFLVDRVFYGVLIVSMKTLLAAMVAFPLAVMFPVLGVAEAPEAVKMEAAVNNEDARIQKEAGTEPGVLGEGWGWVSAKAKEVGAGAEAMVDGLFNKDEQVKKLEAERDQWRAQALEYRNQISVQNVQQGMKHDLMVQCTKELTEYLKSIPK
jgi:hypothetical protein